MNQNQIFGELRGLLLRPSKENWEGLCALVGALPQAQQQHEIVPYLQHHLSKWPVEMCMAPWAWIEPLFAGESGPAALKMARAVEVVARKNIHHGFRRFIQNESLSHIEYLNIEECSIGGTRSFKALAEAEQLGHLTTLSLKRVKMDNEQLGLVLDSGRGSKVHTLHLEGNELYAHSVECLLQHEFVLKLKELHLDSNAIGANGCSLLSRAPFERLKVLSLGTARIDSEGMTHLSSSNHFKTVERLELAQNDLGPEGIQNLVNGANWDNLKILSAWSNDIGSQGLSHLAHREGMPQLSLLGLSNNQIDSEGVKALAKSDTSQTLQKLDLRLNQVSEDGCVALGESPHFEGLEGLFLSFNPCTTDGIEALCKAPSWKKMRQLELASTRLYNFDVLLQSEALNQLEELELTGNWLSFEAEDFEGTSRFSSLRMLSMEHCSLNDDDLNVLLENMDTSNLIALYLARNALSGKSIEPLCKRHFERLLLLDVAHNDDVDPLFIKSLARQYRLQHKKRVHSSGGSLHYTLSILDDAAEPVWEILASEVKGRQALSKQIKSLMV